MSRSTAPAFTTVATSAGFVGTSRLDGRAAASGPKGSRFQRCTTGSGSVAPRSIAERETPTSRALTLRDLPRVASPIIDSPS